MLTIETIAVVEPDGTLTVRAPSPVPPGRHRVVVVVDEAEEQPTRGTLPSLAEFRASLGAAPHAGNTVVEAREDERS